MAQKRNFNAEGYHVWPNGNENRYWTLAHQVAEEIFTARREQSGVTKGTPVQFVNSGSLCVQESAVFDQIADLVKAKGINGAIPEAETLAHSLATQYGLAGAP